jgi:hypothetical protein
MKATKKELLKKLKNMKCSETIVKQYFSKENAKKQIYSRIGDIAKKYNIDCYTSQDCTDLIPPDISKNITEMEHLIKNDNVYYKKVFKYPIIFVKDIDPNSKIAISKETYYNNLPSLETFLTALFSPITLNFFTEMYKDIISDITDNFDDIENFKIFMSSALFKSIDFYKAWLSDLNIALLIKQNNHIISVFTYPDFLSNYGNVIYDDTRNTSLMRNVWDQVKKHSTIVYGPKYDVVLEFDLCNDKKHFFLATRNFNYIKDIANINDLAFYTNIRDFHDSINKKLLNIKHEVRENVLNNLINLHLSKCKDYIGKANNTILKNLDIDVDTDGKYPMVCYYSMNTCSYLIALVKIEENRKHIKKINIAKASEFLSDDNKEKYCNEFLHGRPNIYYSLSLTYSINVSPELNKVDFEINNERIDPYYPQFKNLSVDFCGGYREIKKVVKATLEYMRKNILRYFFNVSDNLVDVLYDKDKIDEVLKQGREEIKNKTAAYKQELNNIIKNKNNKSFLDIITILLYKEVLTNKMIRYETLHLYSSNLNRKE